MKILIYNSKLEMAYTLLGGHMESQDCTKARPLMPDSAML